MMESNRIRFHFQLPPFHFPGRTGLKEFILSQIQKEGKRVEQMNYIFCTDDYLLQINRTYLDHDTYTDIISFDLSNPGEGITAEIYISVDRVRENAAIFQTGFRNELLRVIFHGALHLCGYKDKSEKDKKEMRKMEEEWMKRMKSEE